MPKMRGTNDELQMFERLQVMEIDILDQSLKDIGYKVVEYPQDNIVELQLRGQLVKKWCATDETVKPKLINGTALQHNYSHNQYIENCRTALECGGAWSNG